VLEGKAGLRRQKPIRLTEHVKAYLLHTAKSNSTSYKDRAVLDTFVASVGDRPIDEVSPFHIERWKQERAEVETGTRGGCQQVNSESRAEHHSRLLFQGRRVGKAGHFADTDRQDVQRGR